IHVGKIQLHGKNAGGPGSGETFQSILPGRPSGGNPASANLAALSRKDYRECIQNHEEQAEDG
ncbi:MAG: hypothetical protein ABI822_12510, partial [Bryobacteraceae bacterium]